MPVEGRRCPRTSGPWHYRVPVRWDAESASDRAKQRNRLLARYVRHELAAYSDFYRRQVMRAGVDIRSLQGLDSLRGLQPLDWSDVVADPGAFLLRPDEGDIARHGERRLVLSVTWAKLRRRTDQLNRDVIEPLYKPVHWHLDHGLPVASTQYDLDRLGEAGARVFSLAGLSRSDVLVSVASDPDRLAWWQLVHGARAAHLSGIHLGPGADPEMVAAARPSALAGDAESLLEVLGRLDRAGVELDDLHTIVVAGELLDTRTRDRLADAGTAVAGQSDEVAVVAMWSPRGARAMWAECREGGIFHTFPDMEVVEVDTGDGRPRLDGAGELIWSAVGWHGTALFRVRTGVTAVLRDGRCQACGRQGPMVTAGEGVARRRATGEHRSSRKRGGAGASERAVEFRALGEHEDVSAYHVELRKVNGHDETLVFLSLQRDADIGTVLGELDSDLHATQYVVLTRREVETKVKESGGPVADRR